jgi:hypothetical protein
MSDSENGYANRYFVNLQVHYVSTKETLQISKNNRNSNSYTMVQIITSLTSLLLHFHEFLDDSQGSRLDSLHIGLSFI